VRRLLFAQRAHPARVAKLRIGPRGRAESVTRQGFQQSYNAAIERFG